MNAKHLGLTGICEFRVFFVADMQIIGVKSQISLLTRASTRVFKEAKKSEMLRKRKDSDSLITPSELSILNCLMDGGFILSLKVSLVFSIQNLSKCFMLSVPKLRSQCLKSD